VADGVYGKPLKGKVATGEKNKDKERDCFQIGSLSRGKYSLKSKQIYDKIIYVLAFGRSVDYL
jgi:hypothetical protein